MLKNYILIAMRHLLRQRGYGIINIAGLAIGIACFILVGMFVWDELSYDAFHEHADRIYRITLDARLKDEEFLTAKSSGPLAQCLKSEIPGVEAAGRLRVIGD
ncbi:MAG: ABC transporter permease, partial [Bacteroidetes bacterium]|nr:ABC transporter permease [Bacteroidota bacterium]